MRKNKMMRFASGLLVATLLTTCIISGTFAKYTTSSTGNDAARVATWGLDGTNSVVLANLFSKTYTNVASANEDKVIAPGTTGTAKFGFKYVGEQAKPEVAYKFKVSTAGSSIAQNIKDNENIQWKLDNGNYGTWDEMITAIEALDGDTHTDADTDQGKEYAPGNLPEAFNATGANEHSISWQWKFSGDTAGDEKDTSMGNAAKLDDVKLVISISAEQVD